MATSTRLLIVDDDPINRTLLSYGVQQFGYQPEQASDGAVALHMLRESRFDIVLLDLIMPEMDGFQVLQAVKSDVLLRNISVIMVSALDEQESVVRCIELGADDYLPKPCNPVLLRARLNACMSKISWRRQEIEYLEQVSRLTTAAAEIEAATFDSESVAEIARRGDELGNLARVLQRTGSEVRAREERLRQQVQRLSVQIDQGKRAVQVAEVTETEFFQQLQRRSVELRTRREVRSVSAGRGA